MAADAARILELAIDLVRISVPPDSDCDITDEVREVEAELVRFAAAVERGGLVLQVLQNDFMPGWAAYEHRDDEKMHPDSKPVILLNIGSLLAAVETGDLKQPDLPYMIAESIMHEVIHALEAWAKVEFSEEKVEALLAKYRAKYQRDTVWLPDSIETRNSEALQDFSNYCVANPQQRFWQALRNWSGYHFVEVSDADIHFNPINRQDTFNWETKRGDAPEAAPQV